MHNRADIARLPAAQSAKAEIRNKIAKDVGDPDTLIGTASDAAALSLYGVAALIKIFGEHGSASIKANLAEFAGGQLPDLADRYLGGLEDGSVKLPALEKGLEATVQDVLTRQTKVAAILADQD